MLEYPDKLVLRINELYYTLGGEDYDCSHEEILILEPPRWKRVAGALVANSAHQKKTILDVGSGTGFVATVLGPYLTDKDQFICLDISQKFLDQCKLNLENKKFKCQLVYKQYNGMLLPFEDKSIDILTLNSVLHHIPNTELFLGEVDRVLKRGGYLVIGHEANRRFYKNKAVWTLYRILYVFLIRHPL
ncbi:MAG: class I SAM-dependent methyltransferase [bacterium]|nr:class I SAM-dependent methyltransferase [bacterium]